MVEDDILLSNLVQSVEVRRPRDVAEDEGMFHVWVFPAEVTVKSVPVVEVANVWVVPVCPDEYWALKVYVVFVSHELVEV
jgi:hypothetical protein